MNIALPVPDLDSIDQPIEKLFSVQIEDILKEISCAIQVSAHSQNPTEIFMCVLISLLVFGCAVPRAFGPVVDPGRVFTRSASTRGIFMTVCAFVGWSGSHGVSGQDCCVKNWVASNWRWLGRRVSLAYLKLTMEGNLRGFEDLRHVMSSPSLRIWTEWFAYPSCKVGGSCQKALNLDSTSLSLHSFEVCPKIYRTKSELERSASTYYCGFGKQPSTFYCSDCKCAPIVVTVVA